jgi:hypothetical protein
MHHFLKYLIPKIFNLYNFPLLKNYSIEHNHADNNKKLKKNGTTITIKEWLRDVLGRSCRTRKFQNRDTALHDEILPGQSSHTQLNSGLTSPSTPKVHFSKLNMKLSL